MGRVSVRFADRRAEFNRLVINRAVRPLSGRVVLSGKTFEVRDPRIVPTGEAVSLLRAPWRQVVTAARVPSTLLLERADD